MSEKKPKVQDPREYAKHFVKKELEGRREPDPQPSVNHITEAQGFTPIDPNDEAFDKLRYKNMTEYDAAQPSVNHITEDGITGEIWQKAYDEAKKGDYTALECALIADGAEYGYSLAQTALASRDAEIEKLKESYDPEKIIVECPGCKEQFPLMGTESQYKTVDELSRRIKELEAQVQTDGISLGTPFDDSNKINSTIQEQAAKIAELEGKLEVDGLCLKDRLALIEHQADKIEELKAELKELGYNLMRGRYEDEQTKKIAELEKRELYLRNRLVSILPTGEASAFDLIKSIGKFIKEWDGLTNDAPDTERIK